MYHQLLLLELLEEEKKRYHNLIHCLEERQSLLPQGSLAYRNGHYYRAVTYNGKRDQIIISKKLPDHETLIQQLKERRHISKALPILKRNMSSCENAINSLELYDPKALTALLPEHYAGFQEKRLYLEEDVDPELWKREAYEKNSAFPEALIHPSEGGLLTRSKSEAAIATKLEQNALLFRYEPAVHLGKKTCFPDFCVLHPINRRQIYWEHLGKMDDLDYILKNIKKLWDYAEHGYQLGDNLIITWETKARPLTYGEINDRIRTYFLTGEKPYGQKNM